jgi:antitoxin HigA-1
MGNGRLVTSGLPVIKEFVRSIHTSRLLGTDKPTNLPRKRILDARNVTDYTCVHEKKEGPAMNCPPHPGAVLREHMGTADVTAFAARVGVNRVSMSRLLNGQNGISPHMALRLAKVLGTDPEMWLTLQMQYDLWHAREDLREAASKRQFVNEHISGIVFKSQSRPGRTVRVNRYHAAVTANKRRMKGQKRTEAGLFEL